MIHFQALLILDLQMMWCRNIKNEFLVKTKTKSLRSVRVSNEVSEISESTPHTPNQGLLCNLWENYGKMYLELFNYLFCAGIASKWCIRVWIGRPEFVRETHSSVYKRRLNDTIDRTKIISPSPFHTRQYIPAYLLLEGRATSKS